MKPIEQIQELDKNFKVPGFPKPPYSDDHPLILQRRESIAKLNSVISEFTEMFKIHLEEDIPDVPKTLNFSADSLKVLDEHLYKKDYPNFYSKDYLNSEFIPLLWGYILKTLFMNIKSLNWKYSSSVKKHILQPNMGGRIFNPYEVAELAVYSGFRVFDFFRVVYDYCFMYEIQIGKMEKFRQNMN